MNGRVQLRETISGFTLVEIMLVLFGAVAVMALIMAGYSAAVQASAVGTGADMISDAMVEARASAVAENTTVEVRIYDLPPAPGTNPAYDVLQLHWLKPDGTTPAVARPVLLTPYAAIDETALHSPLIAANTQTATPDFHFLPDGSTDLSPATTWFLTVRPVNQSDPARFPSNWACVSVDATTGRPQVYRP